MDSELKDKLYTIRHSLAHVMAYAVKSMFPKAQLGFGPPTEHGFYYDFDFGEESFDEKSLKKIEKTMKKILSKDVSFVREDSGKEEALKWSSEINESYKGMQVENLSEKGESQFSFYQCGGFKDLCEGPHVEHFSDLRKVAFKLDRVAGAYWLGSEKNKMLTRIYALCFETKEELDDFLTRRKLAEERDHKKLGKELEIYTIDETVGKGLILWLPNGTVIRDEVEKYAKEVEFRYGYDRVFTPHITREELFIKSQHLPAYQESMFPPITVEEDGDVKERFYLKPMNCPFHHQIYQAKPRSYRDLPLRFAEYGTCYRFEQSGELSGLLRVRGMTMNDAHVYCREEDLDQEIKDILGMYQEFYETFDLHNYSYRLSTRGDGDSDKFKGDPALWELSENLLRKILDELGVEYYVGEGEAAFYGPKIDIQFQNLMGREETVSTVQLDFQGPINFDLKYIDSQGEEKRPVIIHRAPLSTHERFLSFLIEYYGGAFPTWMSPLQVMIVPVSKVFEDYCTDLQKELRNKYYRVACDFSDNSLNKKIRTHVKKKVPLIAIVGESEVKNQSLTLRRYGVKEQVTLGKEEFFKSLDDEIKNRLRVPSQ